MARNLPVLIKKRINSSPMYDRLCDMHNRVNARLGKEEFDCAKLDETYDCGCGDEPLLGGPKKSDSSDGGDMKKEDGTHPEPGMIRGG